jgi:hypothetical protein
MRGLAFRGKFGANKRAVCAMSLHHSDNVLVHNCTFDEASGTGHRFDLQGCRYVTIRDNVFRGFDTSYGELYAEDIQADFSARIGASYPEPDLTRYDGLPSRDILVENNRWLPLTIGGTTYPAANPFGSHATMVGRREAFVGGRDAYVPLLVSPVCVSKGIALTSRLAWSVRLARQVYQIEADEYGCNRQQILPPRLPDKFNLHDICLYRQILSRIYRPPARLRPAGCQTQIPSANHAARIPFRTRAGLYFGR